MNTLRITDCLSVFRDRRGNLHVKVAVIEPDKNLIWSVAYARSLLPQSRKPVSLWDRCGKISTETGGGKIVVTGGGRSVTITTDELKQALNAVKFVDETVAAKAQPVLVQRRQLC